MPLLKEYPYEWLQSGARSSPERTIPRWPPVTTIHDLPDFRTPRDSRHSDLRCYLEEMMPPDTNRSPSFAGRDIRLGGRKPSTRS
jgi:hypothetical protein